MFLPQCEQPSITPIQNKAPNIFASFPSCFHICHPCTNYLNAIFNLFLHIRIKKTTHICVLSTALTLKDVPIISYTSDVVLLSLKQNRMQMYHSFKSAIRKSINTLIMNNNKCQLTSYTDSYSHTTQHSTSEDAVTTEPWQNALHTTCSSMFEVIPVCYLNIYFITIRFCQHS